ncbi:hypothetical protein JRO89_XS03G0139500 [Xanthoceras sorbifolium]|uniref:Uncharacterized protein n=1 Tax=Xanthoceras sorbifolium TaxID=99658 RepID=A0ABQ8I9S4_9ROSI|nr:hypothetical protein JRO89_XS03G0139500 [Xanthoceras sorbifolium]
MHELLLREIWHDDPCDEMRFQLGQYTVQLSRVDFCLITGLKVKKLPDMTQYGEVADEIYHMYFNLRNDMTIHNVKDALELGRFVWMLQLVDNLEAFGAFPWRSFIYSHSILSYMLSQAVHGKSYKKKQLDNALGKHPNVKYNLYSFVWALKNTDIPVSGRTNDAVISPDILIRDACVDPGQHIHCIEDCPSIRPNSRQDTAALESTHPPPPPALSLARDKLNLFREEIDGCRCLIACLHQ